MRVVKVIAVIIFGLTIEASLAETPLRPIIVVPETVTVAKDSILLGDISQITVPDATENELLARLRQINLGAAPAPHQSTTILGSTILGQLEAAGIDRKSIGYSFPTNVIVQRDGREISEQELISIARSKLNGQNGDDLRISAISWQGPTAIPIGETSFDVQSLGDPNNGKLPLRFEVSVNGSVHARFLATATVDLWREVAVISRTLERGMLISSDDVQFVRMNVNQSSGDLVRSAEEAIGQKAKSRILAGSVIRKNLIDYPATVTKGKRVVLRYNDGGLSATASAVAAEDGLLGEVITVINETSKKQVRGTIRSPEEVEVQSQ